MHKNYQVNFKKWIFRGHFIDVSRLPRFEKIFLDETVQLCRPRWQLEGKRQTLLSVFEMAILRIMA